LEGTHDDAFSAHHSYRNGGKGRKNKKKGRRICCSKLWIHREGRGKKVTHFFIVLTRPCARTGGKKGEKGSAFPRNGSKKRGEGGVSKPTISTSASRTRSFSDHDFNKKKKERYQSKGLLRREKGKRERGRAFYHNSKRLFATRRSRAGGRKRGEEGDASLITAGGGSQRRKKGSGPCTCRFFHP